MVESLERQGVRYVFGIPGAKIDKVFDTLASSSIQTIVCRHEQNAAFIAGGIGRLTGKAGVAIATSGPGVSNLTTGLLTANSEGDPEVNLFKQQMAEKLYYSQVYYRSIPNQNVKNGLEWFVENVGFDMMVMVHRKSSLYDYFFKPSITKKIADQVYVPLLVYPYPVDSLPNF